MNPEQCCCLKVNLFILGFLILKILHQLKVSIISINFATDFCLKDRFPPQHSKFVLKKTLKSSTSERFSFLFMSVVFIIVKSVSKTPTCSFSLLGVYKLLKTKFWHLWLHLKSRYCLCCQKFSLKHLHCCFLRPLIEFK